MYEISDYDIKCDRTEKLQEIPYITSNISYEEFFENYLLKNKPCIIEDIAKNWPATKDWVKNNQPNMGHLKRYNNLEVCVSDCNERYFNAQKTKCYTVENYLDYWEKCINNNCENDKQLLYLKDWHLKKNSDDIFYTIPIYFASDWLNEYFSEKTDDDYMFVYMGPKGTWTPFHVDVFTSYSWSTNICGKKEWYLFPPGEEYKLKDSFGNLPYDVTTCDLSNTTYFKVIQNPGEAIFVPSGWHHQVWNLENTVSINHNWVNGCNVKEMWFSITENLKSVKMEISDCRDMDDWIQHCQVVLKASHGIDFFMFFDFLLHISVKRLNMLKKNECKVFSEFQIGKNHAAFDLLKIKEVLELFLRHEDFKEFNFVSDKSPSQLYNDIVEATDNK